MNRTNTIINDLNTFINEKSFSKANIVIHLLEETLRDNIYQDEELADANKELVFVEINEVIKKATVQALLVMNRNAKGVRVYLDDKRPTPNGYIRAFWPEDVISYVEALDVTELSLDHDLGDDNHGTGNDVVCYIEEKVYSSDYIAPLMSVHSDNSSARAKMMAGIHNIIERQNRR